MLSALKFGKVQADNLERCRLIFGNGMHPKTAEKQFKNWSIPIYTGILSLSQDCELDYRDFVLSNDDPVEGVC